MTERGNFGSKLGMVLATAGSAVGLGNIWRFPYMTGQNGGAAFLLTYVGCILLLGVPGMISEFIVGRHAQTNAARAYDKLSEGRPWKLVGHLGILTSTIILGFYVVVAGWCLQYLFASISGQIQGDSQYVQQYFVDFSSNVWKPVLFGLLFILMTHLIVVRGVRGGIEKASKLLMPILLILLVILVIASCMLPGAMEGVKFLLYPDFSKINGNVALEALGQAFFSLSLGTACLCTYASYFSPKTNLLYSAGQIALLDTMIAILSGLLIFPAAAAVGISADSGPSARGGLCGQHHVLCPAGIRRPDIDHLHARDRHRLLYGRVPHASQIRCLGAYHHRQCALCALLVVGRRYRYQGLGSVAHGLLRPADSQRHAALGWYAGLSVCGLVYSASAGLRRVHQQRTT